MESNVIKIKECSPDFVKEVIAAGGEKADICYQCGTCSAGCPTVYAMDYTPRQIIRMVNLGMKKEVLESDTIWVCATCYTCQTRCPRGVEITSVMNALKSIAIKEGTKTKNKLGPIFHNAFADITLSYGKIHEPALMAKIAMDNNPSFPNALIHLMRNATLGLEMTKRGKISILPHKIKGVDHLKIIYKNVRRIEGVK